MSASWSGSMRGPRVKTPFLLLLLLSALTGTVLCQDYYDGGNPGTETEEEAVPEEVVPEEAVPEEAVPEEAVPEEVENGDEETSESSADPDATPTTTLTDPVELGTEETGSGHSSTTPGYDGSTYTPVSTEEPPSDEEGLSPIIILIPVVLVVVIIGMIVCGIFINRRWNKKASNQELGKEDPYLDGSSTEKVPMPMFEEDVPSVLELEMEELDQWMKKDEDSKHA